jgi:hypothetical protein
MKPDYSYLNALKGAAYTQRDMRLFWAVNLVILELLAMPDQVCEATIRDYLEAKRTETRR